MKNQITLTNETINELRTLLNNIDGESNKSCNDYNMDLVTESEFRILDLVREIVFPKKTIECTTVTLKLHLYTMDEDDNYVPMVGEELEEVVDMIKSADNVMGYSITDMSVDTEELDITNWN